MVISVQDRLQDLQRTQVEHDIAELLVECTERRVERRTVAVVVGVPSGGPHESAQLMAVRAALVCGAARPARPASSGFSFEVVAVPLAGATIPPGASASA